MKSPDLRISPRPVQDRLGPFLGVDARERLATGSQLVRSWLSGRLCCCGLSVLEFELRLVSYWIMTPKSKRTDAGSSGMPKRRHKVLFTPREAHSSLVLCQKACHSPGFTSSRRCFISQHHKKGEHTPYFT